ncbi:MAG: acyl carrier protein [Oscillospiraceae bacterium]|nr:acyl carrier protein [Oscillospiraceae bacterium]
MDKLMGILLELNPDIDYEKETALIDAGLLDSFDIVTLVSEIDDVFGVEIPAQALTPENFNSAKALYGLIRRLQEC